MELSEAAKFLVLQLDNDIQSGDCVYGEVNPDTNTYTPYWAAWAPLSEKQGDFILLRAILTAQEGIQGAVLGTGLLDAVRGFEALLGSTVPSYSGPKKLVNTLSDLEAVTYIDPEYREVLRKICVGVAKYWYENLKFRGIVVDSLEKALGDIVEKTQWSSSRLRTQACAVVPTPMSVTKSRQIRPYALSWEEEDILALSGERGGVYRISPYLVFNIPTFCTSVCTAPWLTPYAPLKLINSVESGNARDGDALRESVHATMRARYGRGAHRRIREQLATKLGVSVEDIYVCRRDAVTSQIPERKLPSMRGSRRGTTRVEGKLVDGLRLYFRYGKVCADPTSFDEPAILAPRLTTPIDGPRFMSPAVWYHSGPDERGKILETTLYTVSVFERVAFLVPEERREAYLKKVAAMVNVVLQVNGDRVRFRQLGDASRPAAGRKKARAHYAFTLQQDNYIREYWRPHRTPTEARKKLEALMPDHPWRRITVRGQLILELERLQRLDLLSNPKEMPTSLYRRYRWAVGGAQRQDAR